MAKTLAASAEAAQQFEEAADSELRSKVVGAVHKLQKGLLERETEVSSCLQHGCSPGAHGRTPYAHTYGTRF